ncbi:hypothetical protein E0H35_07495 [Rhizobium leguminosarum bv. viciae]|nr:hypothetical protein [Rhizobium leguminosarum bv. viciae]TBZ02712.1 hypothetical protein E0H35_07495 [Rhizobium leguminosarum bv. viciae]
MCETRAIWELRRDTIAMEETYRALNPFPGSVLFVAQSAKTNKSAGDLKWRCNTGETPSRKVPTSWAW